MNSKAICSLKTFLESPIDFLIVGGGSAGLVLANRLSEDPNVRVAVLEAGAGHLGDPTVEKLNGMAAMLHNPEYDWTFKSVPQAGNLNRVHHVARGKVLGGCSAVNFMAYARPSREDIDDWERKFGIEGWTWSNLDRYFLKSEKLELDYPNIQNRDHNKCPLKPELHGTRGPIHNSFSPWQSPLEADLLAAFDETSQFSRPSEPSSGSHLGFYRSLFTVDRSGLPTRSYAGNGYLTPMLDRPNLKVLTNAVACKVLLDQTNSAARGIEFWSEGSMHQVFANKEVILSCGSVQSPQILELSGIGDPQILKAAGIPCRVPIPEVGRNLQEKPVSSVVYEVAPGELSLDSILRNPDLLKEHAKLLTEQHNGAFSGPISLMGFLPYCSQVSAEEVERTVSSILSHRSNDFQDIQRDSIAAHLRSPHSGDLQFVGIPTNFDTEAYNNVSKLNPGPPPNRTACYSIMFSTMYPISRGSVHIQSADPLAPPRIDLGFLSHPADVDVLAAAAGFIDRVFKSEKMRNKIFDRVSPPSSIDLQDRDQARQFIREHIVTYHHALGTCSMGQVVDGRLRVRGVQRLRVVDASVLPMQMSAAIMATVYAVAEKASDIIKEDNSN